MGRRVAAGVKDIHDTQVGDTITGFDQPTSEPFPGFKPAQPVVFSGLYPTDTEDYRKLRDALDKLKLNDAAFTFEPETSEALGFGFRCGFLGLLHAEIVQEAGSWWVRDRDSTNGTLLNGAPVAAFTAIRPGDVLQFGHIRLQVVPGDEPTGAAR